MIDIYIQKYRWVILSILIVVILGGSVVIWLNKKNIQQVSQEKAQITELQKQNDELRKELSGQSSKSVAGATSEENAEKININTADSVTLDKLPNIGPARAADIIAYRNSHGGFKSIEEIKNIKGIGDKSFEQLKNLITVGK